MKQWSIVSARGKLILSATILASGFVFLFGAAISIALPAIQAEFDTGLSNIQWVINAYSLALGVFILLSGTLSDHYGRKRVFLIGAAIFIAGLLLSGFAHSISALIAYQVVLGIGAAMMVPVSLAIVHACFLEREQGRAIGLWTGLSAVFAAAGPFVGGVAVDIFGWEALFLGLAPLALLVMFVVWRFVPETRAQGPGALDVWGAVTLGAGLFGALFALIQGPVLGWGHGAILAALTLSVVSFVALTFAIEPRARNPIIPLQIFRAPRVLGANLVTLLLYFVLGGTIFFLTLNFQQIQGISPAWTGAALLPPIALIALFSGATGRLVDALGARVPMIGGPLLVALGTALMLPAGADANYFTAFLPGLILIGVGMVVVIPALTVSALSVQDKYTGAASGVNNAASRTSWLFAVAVLGMVAQMVFAGALEERVEARALPAEVREEVLSQKDRYGGIEVPRAFGARAQAEARGAVGEAFVESFRAVLIVNLILALLASLVSFFYIRKRKKS